MDPIATGLCLCYHRFFAKLMSNAVARSRLAGPGDLDEEQYPAPTVAPVSKAFVQH